MATYWITKYCLSGKITSIEAEPESYGSGQSELWVRTSGYSWTSFKVGRDAFDNEADAKADAEARRQKKIASLRKQIAKLEKLQF